MVGVDAALIERVGRGLDGGRRGACRWRRASGSTPSSASGSRESPAQTAEPRRSRSGPCASRSLERGGERITRSTRLPGGRADVRDRSTTVAMHLLRGCVARASAGRWRTVVGVTDRRAGAAVCRARASRRGPRALVEWRERVLDDVAEGSARRRVGAARDAVLPRLADTGEVEAIGRRVCGVRGLGAVQLALGDAGAAPAPAAAGARGGARGSARGPRQVQGALSRVLEAEGFYEPEARPFYGHVTVARAGRGGGSRAAPCSPAPDPLRFGSSTVVLYRLTCGAAAPGTSRCERLELGGAPRLSPRPG